MTTQPRGIARVSDLRRKSHVGPTGCWHWLGAKDPRGAPRIWALDYDRREKRVLTAPQAAWYVGFGSPLNGRLPYRKCFCTDCVNPDHIRVAETKQEIFGAIARAGVLKLTEDAERIAVAQRTRDVMRRKGIQEVPEDVVRAIVNAPAIVTGRELAALHGLSQQKVSRIRSRKSYRWVQL